MDGAKVSAGLRAGCRLGSILALRFAANVDRGRALPGGIVRAIMAAAVVGLAVSAAMH
jgi:hypothetical protein